MQRVELGTVFIDVFEVVKKYVPESDIRLMLEELISNMIDEGYELEDLYGEDDLLDSVLDSFNISSDYLDEYEDDEEEEE